MYNVEGKIGGDAPLSPRGLQYARALPGLIREKLGEDTNLTVWTSTLQRTIQTAEYLPFTKLTWKSLDELDAGVCDGMTYEEIEVSLGSNVPSWTVYRLFYHIREMNIQEGGSARLTLVPGSVSRGLCEPRRR